MCVIELLREHMERILPISRMIQGLKDTLMQGFKALRSEEQYTGYPRYTPISLPLRMQVICMGGMLLEEFRSDLNV